MKKKVISGILLVIGILILFSAYRNLSDDNRKRKKIQGTFDSITKERGYKAGRSSYKIKLNEFENDFFIPNLFLKSFDAESFKSKVNRNDTVTLLINNEVDLKKNNTSIHSLKKGEIEFIDQDSREGKRESNGTLALLLGLGFIGLSVLQYRRPLTF